MKIIKSTAILAAASLLLVACAKTSTTPKEDTVENSVPGNEITIETTETPEDLVATCEGNSDPLKQAGCYWTKAFENSDQSICDLIPTKSEEEIKTALKAAGQEGEEYYLHLTPERCKDEFAYSYEDANWSIESGIPPYPELINVYTGEATLTGWIVYTPAYVGAPEAHFHVADEDVKKLPVSLQNHENYVLVEPNTEVRNLFRLNNDMIKQLEAATENDPATIVVDRAAIATEGSPTFRLVEIVKD